MYQHNMQLIARLSVCSDRCVFNPPPWALPFAVLLCCLCSFDPYCTGLRVFAESLLTIPAGTHSPPEPAVTSPNPLRHRDRV